MGVAAPWPQHGVDKVQKVHVGRFALEVPAQAESINYIPDAPLVFNMGRYKLAVSLVYPADIFGPGTDAFKGSQFRLIDYPGLIYSRTRKTPLPSDDKDMRIVRAALEEKSSRFVGLKKANIYTKEGVTAYYAEINFSEFTGDLILTHTDIPDRYVRVLMSSGNPEVLLKLIPTFVKVGQ
ncbi:MAG: hypothetical protein AABY83_03135 [Pseudomonadota bacterium]